MVAESGMVNPLACGGPEKVHHHSSRRNKWAKRKTVTEYNSGGQIVE
jgi:hypothetical protein